MAFAYNPNARKVVFQASCNSLEAKNHPKRNVNRIHFCRAVVVEPEDRKGGEGDFQDPD